MIKQDYQDFISGKLKKVEPTGFDVEIKSLNDKLFDFQKAIVKWALKRGRAAIFADTGLGKSFMQIEWAWQVFQYTGNRVLVLAPLCVAEQTVKEADKLGYKIRYERSFGKDQYGPTDNGNTGIIITNYEMIHEFEDAIKAGYFDGIVLDESSIIKHKDSKTRNHIISLAKDVPYKLSATATPSPNDYMELGNQAEFLGVMSMVEMLAMFFIHDSGQTSKWRLKGHGQSRFWQWLAGWAVTIKKPSDLGFSDHGYDLPGLDIEEILVPSKHTIEDNSTLSGRNEARRLSIDERVEKAAAIVNADSSSQYIVWCNLNDESQKLADLIHGSVEVKGSDKIEQKEKRITLFTEGSARVIVTKPSIAGFGMNWQHCHKMIFVGLNDSYEQLYQAIRRCYRFGQTEVVKVFLVSSELEGAVRSNLLEKEERAQVMSREMVEHMKDFTRREVVSLETEKTDYCPDEEMILPGFLVGAA